LALSRISQALPELALASNLIARNLIAQKLPGWNQSVIERAALESIEPEPAGTRGSRYNPTVSSITKNVNTNHP
jgi:hypothetical protein